MISYIIDIIDGIRIFLWIFFTMGATGLIVFNLTSIEEDHDRDDLIETAIKITLITGILLIILPSHETLLEMLK